MYNVVKSVEKEAVLEPAGMAKYSGSMCQIFNTHIPRPSNYTSRNLFYQYTYSFMQSVIHISIYLILILHFNIPAQTGKNLNIHQ